MCNAAEGLEGHLVVRAVERLERLVAAQNLRNQLVLYIIYNIIIIF